MFCPFHTRPARERIRLSTFCIPISRIEIWANQFRNALRSSQSSERRSQLPRSEFLESCVLPTWRVDVLTETAASIETASSSHLHEMEVLLWEWLLGFLLWLVFNGDRGFAAKLATCLTLVGSIHPQTIPSLFCQLMLYAGHWPSLGCGVIARWYRILCKAHRPFECVLFCVMFKVVFYYSHEMSDETGWTIAGRYEEWWGNSMEI